MNSDPEKWVISTSQYSETNDQNTNRFTFVSEKSVYLQLHGVLGRY